MVERSDETYQTCAADDRIVKGSLLEASTLEDSWQLTAAWLKFLLGPSPRRGLSTFSAFGSAFALRVS